MFAAAVYSHDVPLADLDAHSEGCLTKLIDFSVRKASRSQPPSPSPGYAQQQDTRRGGGGGGGGDRPPPVARRPPPSPSSSVASQDRGDRRHGQSRSRGYGGRGADGGGAAAASRSRSSREHRAQRMEEATGWLGSPPQTRSPTRRGGGGGHR